MEKLSGSLHSHGCWTDYRIAEEQLKFPFKLKDFAEFCISHGRDFQAITDIMANRPGKPEFIEKRYDALLDTANSKDKSYELQRGETESTIFFKNGSKLIIPRTQEILTDVNYKHILAIGVKGDIPGGGDALLRLKLIKSFGGRAILDHPFMCDAWNEDEVMELYDRGLVLAPEWNGGLSFPSFFFSSPLVRKLQETPNKKSNKRVVWLEEEKGIPYVANDDAHCALDIKKGAFTTYLVDKKDENLSLIDKIVKAINSEYINQIERHKNYSSFSSPLNHVKYGKLSQKIFQEDGLPDA